MKLTPLPAFSDNYIWMLQNGHGALVVDPGDAQPVLSALQSEALRLEAILVTHHHPDHTGGIEALQQATGAVVIGPQDEPIESLTRRVRGGDVVAALGMDWQVIAVPGHTAGHIAFYGAPAGQPGILFCGDTLFSAGCGRLFEGTPDQMLASLDALAALPADTRVCCAHEYTLSNLRFARAVEPHNPAMQQYEQHCQLLRAQDRPTLPSTLAQELQINPFLRVREAAVRATARQRDPAAEDAVAVLACLRQWKNEFR